MQLSATMSEPLSHHPPSPSSWTKTALSAGGLIFLDIFFRRIFQAAKINFPSSLAGCGALFTIMVTIPAVGRRVHHILQPGAALLAKWLPVFFVPSLVTLPLAGNVGSTSEVSLIENGA
jgi:putative effector of murein hydrolase LrgA (UPF0299 family)